MILEDAHRLAHRHDDAELAVGVIVGENFWAPQEEIIRTPSEGRMEFVIDDFGQRGGENLTRLEGLIGRKFRIDIEIEAIVTLLPEVQQQPSADPSTEDYDNDRDCNGSGSARHPILAPQAPLRGSLCTPRSRS